ncbi:hypothetical protein [Streptomyces boncukensis]|uniref:Uncharacterized protein n=1 Tax=Streptomyces boncukensis TaxID=2711219 RepID=A0A6G4X137_9ACTN|nr:hypothetical protein [Streptomyces boncukensis]NGO71098.1 hypothetical protein [Streptomyces boncukensis]
MTADEGTTAALDQCRGALVRDTEAGFVGVLVDVLHGFVDPARPRSTIPHDLVFIRPCGGGREHTAAPDTVCLLQSAPEREACTHPDTEERDGKIYCTSCDAQLYL